ncbi:MAG: DUF4337 domain-containing protein [Hyphomicrobiaceae bacterium]|nr:DUF4337 domain-containing protein [Hyphomicrobiaceae bacterium]
MAFDDLLGGRDEDRSASRERDRWIGVYIGVLAVLLALCSMGGGNAAKDATQSNIEASNIWAFFQAKNIRRQVIRAQIEDLEVLLATAPALADPQKSMIAEKIAAHRTFEAKLTTDTQSGEGLDELFKKGKTVEARRDAAMAKDPYFDYGQALLQIAIVLASVAIISGGSSLLGLSFVLGALGTLTTLNGFLMVVRFPFIG